MFPEFRQRPPWWGGDLQTVRNTLMPKPRPFEGERMMLALDAESGDQLSVLHNAGEEGKPTIILMHGLAGSETSSYMVMTARYLNQQGYPVMRWNLRGAGPSRISCKLQYHAGRSQDLRDAIQSLPQSLKKNGLVLVGFSLSGNMTLKFAAEYANELPVRAVISVSAPIDLAVTSANMLRPRNHIYNLSLLKDYKQQCMQEGAQVTAEEIDAISRSRNFVDFDNFFVAPRNGFRDAEDYWARSHAKQFLMDIRLPALLIHSQDDPMVPFEPYRDVPWQERKNLTTIFPRHGGHLGFHDRNGVWYPRCIQRYLESMGL